MCHSSKNRSLVEAEVQFEAEKRSNGSPQRVPKFIFWAQEGGDDGACRHREIISFTIVIVYIWVFQEGQKGQ